MLTTDQGSQFESGLVKELTSLLCCTWIPQHIIPMLMVLWNGA